MKGVGVKTPVRARSEYKHGAASFDRTSRFHADRNDYVPATACDIAVGPGSYTPPKTATFLLKRSYNVTYGAQ